MAGPGDPAAGGHLGLPPSHMGIGRLPTRDGPGGACAPGWPPSRGLVVLGSTGARLPTAHCAGAPPRGPAPGAGQPPLPLLALATGAVPSHFGGLGDGVDGPACHAAMRVASTKLEKSLLGRRDVFIVKTEVLSDQRNVAAWFALPVTDVQLTVYIIVVLVSVHF